MRVDALLGTHFQCKPKGPRVCAALAAGRVTLRDVDGVEHVISDATFQLVVGAETLTCDGTALPRPFQRILAVHKEANAAADDAIDSGLAHPALGQVGRLDKDTSGLILCGTDGGIQCLLAHPCSHVRKTYCVQLGPSRYARVHATEGPPSDTGPLDADAEAGHQVRRSDARAAWGSPRSNNASGGHAPPFQAHGGRVRRDRRGLGADGRRAGAPRGFGAGDRATCVRRRARRDRQGGPTGAPRWISACGVQIRRGPAVRAVYPRAEAEEPRRRCGFCCVWPCCVNRT